MAALIRRLMSAPSAPVAITLRSQPRVKTAPRQVTYGPGGVLAGLQDRAVGVERGRGRVPGDEHLGQGAQLPVHRQLHRGQVRLRSYSRGRSTRSSSGATSVMRRSASPTSVRVADRPECRRAREPLSGRHVLMRTPTAPFDPARVVEDSLGVRQARTPQELNEVLVAVGQAENLASRSDATTPRRAGAVDDYRCTHLSRVHPVPLLVALTTSSTKRWIVLPSVGLSRLPPTEAVGAPRDHGRAAHLSARLLGAGHRLLRTRNARSRSPSGRRTCACCPGGHGQDAGGPAPGREKTSDKGTKSARKRVDPLRRQTGLPRETVIER